MTSSRHDEPEDAAADRRGPGEHALFTTPEERQLGQKIVDSIMRDVARQMILAGDVDPSELTVERLHQLALGRIKQHVEEGADFAMVVDHSATILEDARSYRLTGKEEYAFVFYGLYLEHILNRAIRDRSIQLDLTEREAIELMRRPLPDKTGLTWRLLFGEEFPSPLRSDLEFVAGRRNAFIHYKWQSDPETHMMPDEIKARREHAFTIAERAATQLDAHVRRLFSTDGGPVDRWLYREDDEKADDDDG